jgi:bifunctional non-homologous end joining protein LigD
MRKLSAATNKFIEPMYATTVRGLPNGSDWLYEIKFDGYRCIAARDAKGVRLWSRRGNSLTTQFSAIAAACKNLPPNTVVDGEIVAFDQSGKISFNLLQHHRGQATAMRYYLFDVLVYRGLNLVHLPLAQRRLVLAKLTRWTSALALSEAIDAPMSELIRAFTEMGFEGVIAKRRDSRYESGERTGAWVKYKINKSQEMVIGGYTPGNPFDSIIVGYYQGHELMFAGKVRNGFVPHVRRELMARMKPLETDACPFANLPEKRRTQWALTREEMKNCHWLKPVLVAQIEFTEWTPDGHLRHAKYVGLRPDKKARDVVRELG